jgi:hypothetical protein
VSVAKERPNRWAPFALGIALCAIAPLADACGFDDPSSIGMQRGMLSLAYPEALHVGTAVWQAQLAGRLPRDPVAQFGELSPEQRGTLRLARARLLLGRFAATLADDTAAAPRSNLAVVLVGPVMWSRMESGGGTVKPALHVAGPEPGDVVLVTDIAAIEAIAGGTLSFSEALDLGVVRLYGPPADVAATRHWLTGRARG